MSRGTYSSGSTSLADFKQMALLGEGAYSAVYKVLRLADHEVYALKKVKLPSLSDKEKQNALNEVRLLASVQNENIIAYKEAFFDEKTRCLCIVQEIADAGDLLQLINRGKQERAYLREADIFRYLEGMCQGLKALHDLRILHRDMKCANVFLSATRDGPIAKLGDFNVSKVAKRGLCMTQTGTPYYASPEVWRDMPYDAKSDMWSLGCVLYEMVALRPPFRAEDMEGLYRKVVKGQYPRIPAHYSQDLGDIIAALLQVHPRHRPSVEQLLQMPQMVRNVPDKLRKQTDDRAGGVLADLLNTIKLPKNVIDLSVCLPKARYGSDNESSVDGSGSHRDQGIPGSAVGSEAHHSAARRQLADPGSPGSRGAAPRDGSRGGDLASNAGRYPPERGYPQDSMDSYLAQVPKQPNVALSPRGAGTPVRGQLAQADSLDAYLQQNTQDYSVNRSLESDIGAASQAPAGPTGAAPLYSQGRGAEGPRGAPQHNGAAGPTINPRYAGGGGSQAGSNRPPREPRRPMSIYARQQYAVVEQNQQPSSPQPQQQAQKETPDGSRRRRSLIPRLF